MRASATHAGFKILAYFYAREVPIKNTPIVFLLGEKKEKEKQDKDKDLLN